MKGKFLLKNLLSCILLVLTCATFLLGWVAIDEDLEIDLNGIEKYFISIIIKLF